jgi:hypothetical protein
MVGSDRRHCESGLFRAKPATGISQIPEAGRRKSIINELPG